MCYYLCVITPNVLSRVADKNNLTIMVKPYIINDTYEYYINNIVFEEVFKNI